MFAEPRPMAAGESVWIEDLTWMEVRDLVREGTTTAIIATGGMEQNGPYLVTGKHNVILAGTCSALARRLGNALCAPIVKLVPEGDLDEVTGHLRYPGTISVRQETFEMMLTDIARSLEIGGFTEIILIGDSGGNQRGLQNVAADLNERWAGTGSVARYVPEYYVYREMLDYMENELGVEQPADDGHHDDFAITSMMMAVDPQSVRTKQRIAAGKFQLFLREI